MLKIVETKRYVITGPDILFGLGNLNKEDTYDRLEMLLIHYNSIMFYILEI